MKRLAIIAAFIILGSWAIYLYYGGDLALSEYLVGHRWGLAR